MTQGRSYLGTDKYVFFELCWGENNLKMYSSPVVMFPFTCFIIVLPCCTTSYSLFLCVYFIFIFYHFSFCHRLAAIQACDQQLLQFRGLSGSLLRWLQSVQDQLQSKEGSLTTEGLLRRVQQIKVRACACVYTYKHIQYKHKQNH